MTGGNRRIADALRAAGPLADALTDGAAALRDVLGARGIVLAVRRDGRTTRGIAGSPEPDAHVVPIRDGEVDATMVVSGDAPGDEVALVVTLALAARFLAESAQTDGLTGVANRRTFDDRLREEWRRAERDGTSIAVAILDIDFFKAYNDRYGHPAGDDALRRVAHAASATLQRAGDRFARYGGEEFAAILPATSLAGGIAGAERIRAAVSGLGIVHPVGRGGRLTASVGVAAVDPAAGGTALGLLAAADRELYRAKAEGRDRVAADGYLSAHVHDEALPQPLSTLVGRDRDVDAVNVAIDSSRVVTITGSAGIGKTRLALAAAHDASARFAHVRFVDAIDALRKGDVLEQIAEAATGATLVVLDGCERHADACREVLDRLRAGPLRFLVTSRVPLRALDESVVRLNPLDAAATRALFLDRARAAGVAIDPDDPDAAALLRRLNGSPLAIELAAARLTTTTAATLLDEFARSSLAGRDDRATLGSLLTDAVATLDPAVAAAFAAVAVFRGAFTATDAAAVIRLDDVEPRRAEELLRAIAERSLLDAASHDGVTRWRMIDPVRDAAAEVPLAEATRRAIYAAHLRWCLGRLDAIAADAGTGTNRTALLESERIIDEVRSALDRALRDDDLLADGAELCIAAVRQWFAIRSPGEGRVHCEAFLDHGSRIPPFALARLHSAAARLAFLEGDLATMESHARAADTLLGDRDLPERSTVLNFLGIGAKFRGDGDDAERIFTSARELNARLGNARGEAIAIGALGSMAFDFRLDPATAAERFLRAAAMFRALGDEFNALVMDGNRAEALVASGDLEEAAATIAVTFDEIQVFGNRAAIAHMLCVQALIDEARGRVDAAGRAMREALPVITEGIPGPLLVMMFEYAARIVRHDDPALAARLIGAAERYAALRSMPLLPIQNIWRRPVVVDGEGALGAAAYAELVDEGRQLDETLMLEALRAYLARYSPENTESATAAFTTYEP